jgi:mono/diheme cytochrome c family protein
LNRSESQKTKSFSERQALLVAITVSCTSLLATLGLALAARPSQFSTVLARNSTTATSRDKTIDVAQGRQLFLRNCAECHGRDARGFLAPGLYDLQIGNALIRQVITNGIKGEMPPFAKELREQDIRALTAYLRTLRAGTG